MYSALCEKKEGVPHVDTWRLSHTINSIFMPALKSFNKFKDGLATVQLALETVAAQRLECYSQEKVDNLNQSYNPDWETKLHASHTEG